MVLMLRVSLEWGRIAHVPANMDRQILQVAVVGVVPPDQTHIFTLSRYDIP